MMTLGKTEVESVLPINRWLPSVARLGLTRCLSPTKPVDILAQVADKCSVYFHYKGQGHSRSPTWYFWQGYGTQRTKYTSA